jgi:hypothetical protein
VASIVGLAAAQPHADITLDMSATLRRRKLVLRRATPQNHLFAILKSQWDKELSAEDSPEEFYRPMMAHAESISKENPPDQRYGIFVLLEEDEDKQVLTCDGLVHINHAWPKTKDATLRLVWNLVAPRFQYLEDLSEDLARIMTAFITESLRLCGTDMRSRELKVYLGNAIDREYATVAASLLETMDDSVSFSVRGSWLHVTMEKAQ